MKNSQITNALLALFLIALMASCQSVTEPKIFEPFTQLPNENSVIVEGYVGSRITNPSPPFEGKQLVWFQVFRVVEAGENIDPTELTENVSHGKEGRINYYLSNDLIDIAKEVGGKTAQVLLTKNELGEYTWEMIDAEVVRIYY